MLGFRPVASQPLAAHRPLSTIARVKQTITAWMTSSGILVQNTVTSQFVIGGVLVSLTGGPPSTATPGQIKAYLAGVFTKKPVKVWNGTAWVVKPVKIWNGSAWVATN
jgi:hypothetical protein